MYFRNIPKKSFEWPRENGGEELAEAMNVLAPASYNIPAW